MKRRGLFGLSAGAALAAVASSRASAAVVDMGWRADRKLIRTASRPTDPGNIGSAVVSITPIDTPFMQYMHGNKFL